MSTFDQFVSSVRRNGVAKASHYFCDIMPPRFMVQTAPSMLQTIPFYVEAVNIPEMSLATQSVKDYGLNREVVVDKNYGTCTMTFFSDQNMSIKMFFDSWLQSTVMSKGGVFMYPEAYTAETLALYHVDNAKQVTYVVIMNNVYPKIVDDIAMSNSAKGPLSFRVNFTCESWDSFQYQVTDNTTEPVKQYFDFESAKGVTQSRTSQLDNVRRAWNFVQLIRTGANKDAIKSAVLNVGTRKIYDIIGKTGADKSTATKIDSILGSVGTGNILKKLEGIIL